jgi:hypothetical protein
VNLRLVAVEDARITADRRASGDFAGASVASHRVTALSAEADVLAKTACAPPAAP